jgi:hypothetical protein
MFLQLKDAMVKSNIVNEVDVLTVEGCYGEV